MRTSAIAFGTVCLVTGTLIGADEGAFRPVLSNHPDLIRPDHQCPVSFSREPLRYYTGQVIREGHRLILDADAYPRAAGRLVRKPTLQRCDGGWTISFTLDPPDDIEVRIVAADGAVIRRLGCGVLGPNAPEPLRKDSLQQEVFWDGRDTEGQPAPADCRVEVRVGLAPGQTCVIATEVRYQDLAVPRDALQCIAIWGAPSPNQESPNAIWDFLLPENVGSDRVRFSRCVVAPENSSQLSVRCTLRWSASGQTLWQAPRVAVAGTPLVKRPPVRVCVVTGTAHSRQRQFKSLQDNIEFYGNLCEAACQQHRPRLIVLPEVALQWGVRRSPLELAVPAPGPETDAFAALARKHQVRIALGMFERDGDAVRNSVVLISPTGAIDGRYWKVHLAAGGEDVSGILPGDSFPVFDTELGRIGCNVCMDSSAAESSRMIGLNGADFLLLPIMGDHRADRWNRGTPIHNEDRWRAIMRTHAMDNQLCMVVARNNAAGSCIVDRKGDLLASNEGDQPFIVADVTLDDGYRIWQGGCFRDVNWLQRRPQLYRAFTDPANHGGLR